MKSGWRSILLRHEVILAIVVIAEWSYFYFSATTVKRGVTFGFGALDSQFDILRHSVEIGLLALAMTPIILTGGIDLSVGSALGLSAVVFGKLWQDAGMSPWVAGILTLCFGGLAGGLNAGLIAKLRLPPLIVTLGTFSLFRGLAEAITRGTATYTGFTSSFLSLGHGRIAGLPTQGWLFLLVAIAVWMLVHRTAFGRTFRAIGFSPEGSRYAGIPVGRRMALVYILAGVIAALAGIIYTARLGQAKADAGMGYELYAITAVVLGGTSIFGGIGSVHGTLLGVAAIAVLTKGLVYARQPQEVGGILTGALLLLALLASTIAKDFSNRAQIIRPSTAPPQPNPSSASPGNRLGAA
jgi:ribose/xylose/arabinose/galactoside ABC-type transport system permease subunit